MLFQHRHEQLNHEMFCPIKTRKFIGTTWWKRDGGELKKTNKQIWRNRIPEIEKEKWNLLLSGSNGQAFVVALNKIRVVARPRINLHFRVDGEEEWLACAVKRLANANFARRDGAKHLRSADIMLRIHFNGIENNWIREATYVSLRIFYHQ